MEVRKKKIKEIGSCNFCDRGMIGKDNNLRFDYRTIFEITAKNMTIRICRGCLDELIIEFKKLPKKKTKANEK